MKATSHNKRSSVNRAAINIPDKPVVLFALIERRYLNQAMAVLIHRIRLAGLLGQWVLPQ